MKLFVKNSFSELFDIHDMYLWENKIHVKSLIFLMIFLSVHSLDPSLPKYQIKFCTSPLCML